MSFLSYFIYKNLCISIMRISRTLVFGGLPENSDDFGKDPENQESIYILI